MNSAFSFKIKTYQILLVILIIGTLIRINSLEATGLWMDEIHSTVGTDPDKTIGEVIEYCKTDQPPVFFVLLHSWFKIFPYNDFYGRLFALITGVLGIASMFFLGREVKNNATGLLAAFLTMINYFHVDFSRQVRFYPLLFFFSSLSYLFFIRVLKRKRLVDFIAYTLFSAALLNTHYYGMVVMMSQLILFVFIIFWKKIKDVKFIAACILSGVVAGLSFVHWLPVIFADVKISQFHIQPVPWYFLAQYYWIYFRDVVTCIISGLLILMAIRSMTSRLIEKKTEIDDVVLIGWIVLSFLIPLVYSWIKIPMLETRYTFIALPAILLLAALGLEGVKEKLTPAMIILFLSFMANVLFVKPLYYVQYPPQQWKEVAREITKTDKDTQLVFSQYAWYYRYYFKLYKSVNPPLEPEFAAFDKQLVNALSVWVITSTQFPDKGLSSGQQESLDKDFKSDESITFTDAVAKHYTRKTSASQ
ncbi:MAG: glycosyltransferase family 39 protein [Bacteroidetes bacterium]|nr:glycosyltransferase family 39 protein [Bacteroidota bacterium]